MMISRSTSGKSTPRRFLLLQGLMGPLFRRIGIALRAAGHEVHKINFNGGDKLFWRLGGDIDYRGDLGRWPDFVAQVIHRHNITDVLLFGDCRPLHRAAIAVCGRLHIPVHVFEEGYIRPDWVTLELGGVNGHSTLPRDPDWYRTQAAFLPSAPVNNPVPSSFRRRASEAIAYNAADILSRWYFRHWNDYRPWHPWREGISWLRRLRQRDAAQARTAETIAEIDRSGRPHMLFPLQLDADAQVRLHSPFRNMEEAIREVIGSFAAHAPADLWLLVKEHPLDNGMRDWRALVTDLAARAGVGDRVRYLETGDIALLVRPAKGVVTINSTTGTLALASNVPVITLGEAVYDIRGVTHQGSLAEFWNNPEQPDAATFAAFCRVLIDRCLIAGGFFSEKALSTVVAGAVERIERATYRTRTEGLSSAVPLESETARIERVVIRGAG